MIMDMFKNKKDNEETVEEQAVTAVPAQEKTPAQLEQEKRFAKAKLRLEKIERLIKQLYQDKKDCYLVLARNTTLDQLATKENLRPLISPLNKNHRLPVIRFATTEAVAGDIAKAFGCVCEERPLVAKVPFANLFQLLNNVTKGGVFLYAMTDGPDTYVDQTVHMGYYVYKGLMEKDAKGYLQYMSVLESLHAVRVTKTPFYVLPAPVATAEEKENGTFQLGLVGQEKQMACPVFASKKIAAKLMQQWNVPEGYELLPLTPEQLVEKLDGMKSRYQGNPFAVFFCGIKGAEMVNSDRLTGLVNELFSAKPEQVKE